MTPDETVQPIRQALISTSDKTGIAELAAELHRLGVAIISTGGTAEMIRKAGIPVKQVAQITGMAEMMDGRIKTLHPAIHAAILAKRDNPQHQQDMKTHQISPIDLVVVNLYPFAATLQQANATHGDLVESIDIGGPAMIRAAAKNHDFVTVLTDANDYRSMIDELVAKGGISRKTRHRLAARAFAHTAAYDSAISGWMAENAGLDRLADRLTLGGERALALRYGENPHQQAALYRIPARSNRHGVITARLAQGKPLSYNNINDTDAAFELVAEFDQPSVVIVKHANPCGVASAKTLADAWQAALACDPISAYGGIVALNRPLTGETAAMIADIFTEVIIAPDADKAAIEALAAKPDLRLMLTGGMPSPDDEGIMIKSVAGGFLAQSRDSGQLDPEQLQPVTKRKPDKAEMHDMLFAWRVAKYVKSNAIVFARGAATLGIGAGQMSRLDASRIAIRKAEEMAAAVEDSHHPLAGSVVASDAFFPFADGLIAATEAGATAIIQPGGSIRDDEIIAAADARGLAMVFTGMRHFRH